MREPYCLLTKLWEPKRSFADRKLLINDGNDISIKATVQSTCLFYGEQG